MPAWDISANAGSFVGGDLWVLDKALGAVSERHKGELIAASPALQECAQTLHLVVLVGHNGDNVHVYSLCMLAVRSGPTSYAG